MAWWDDAWNNVDDVFGEPLGPPDAKEILFGEGPELDMHAQHLFVEAFFDGKEDAYQELVDYFWDEYGLDFEEVFEWEDFREWYGNQ